MNTIDWKKRTAKEACRMIREDVNKMNKASLRDAIIRISTFLEDDDIGEAVTYLDLKRIGEARKQRIDRLEEELVKARRANDESVWACYLKAARATIEEQKEVIEKMKKGEDIPYKYIDSGDGRQFQIEESGKYLVVRRETCSNNGIFDLLGVLEVKA